MTIEPKTVSEESLADAEMHEVDLTKPQEVVYASQDAKIFKTDEEVQRYEDKVTDENMPLEADVIEKRNKPYKR